MAKTRRARIDAENDHRRVTRPRSRIIVKETREYPTGYIQAQSGTAQYDRGSREVSCGEAIIPGGGWLIIRTQKRTDADLRTCLDLPSFAAPDRRELAPLALHDQLFRPRAERALWRGRRRVCSRVRNVRLGSGAAARDGAAAALAAAPPPAAQLSAQLADPRDLLGRPGARAPRGVLRRLPPRARGATRMVHFVTCRCRSMHTGSRILAERRD